MKDMYILAIESSCDETSAAIIKNGTEEIATVVLSQMDTHASFGGVVPEIASRMHVESITMVFEELFNKAQMKLEQIDAIAVTYGPGLIGFPLIALVVSGGHTELIYMKEDYSFEKIGGTLDDAVGEAYDKVARVIGIPYPGGPNVDKLAHIGNDSYNLPLPLDDDSFDFSFSGLKSAVINVKHNLDQKRIDIVPEDLATSFQNRVVEILTKKTMRALKKYNVHRLIIAGGVAANKGLREKFEQLSKNEHFELIVPEIKYCTDNAAMIGSAGYYAYKKGRVAGLDLNAKATDKLH